MKQLVIQIGSKQRIVFTRSTIQFIRDTNATKYLDISYTNGTGIPAQTFTAGQTLYTEGTQGQVGFLKIQSTSNVVLNGNNTFNITVSHYPSSSQANQTKSFVIDGSNCIIDFTYNSPPVTSDVNVATPNRTPYTFSINDFLSNITDPDGDGIDSIALVGTTTGLQYNGSDYVSDTWIPIADISQGKLIYNPLDQDSNYIFTIDYKAKDVYGNISRE